MGFAVNIILIGVVVFMLIRWFFSRPRLRVDFLVVGLKGAGKSTFLVKSEMGKVTTSTILPGFILERANYKDLTFYSWDLTPETIQVQHQIDYTHVHGIIFVIDSTDEKAIQESSAHLNTLMSYPALQKAHILVFANKQDLSGAQCPTIVAKALKLKNKVNERRYWYVQGSCSLSGDGIQDGLKWLFMTVMKESQNEHGATQPVH
ncbi:hypothetical protein CPC16_001336 [Podila verticillata]|nr:hypothetical protein CPC16_001336 [Podila verticillata]